MRNIEAKSYYIVRFNDCDPLAHLNNSKYIDYMLNAREDHLRDDWNMALLDYHKQGYSWVVSNHEIQYLRPALYNEKISIHSTLIEAGDTYVIVEMRMMDETSKSLKAIMWTKFTCVNVKTGKRFEHPEEFMELIRDIVNTEINFAAGLKARIGDFLPERVG